MKHVACCIVLHPTGTPRRTLIADHPDQGHQIIKTALRDDEDPTNAAQRALLDYAGLSAGSVLPLGQNGEVAQNENWHFLLCRVTEPVRDEWQNADPEGGGSPIRLYWQDLDEVPETMNRHHRRAFSWVQMAL
ncbi:MAG: NUDIX domain-containing protein [Pseudomonadota bacterium]